MISPLLYSVKRPIVGASLHSTLLLKSNAIGDIGGNIGPSSAFCSISTRPSHFINEKRTLTILLHNITKHEMSLYLGAGEGQARSLVYITFDKAICFADVSPPNVLAFSGCRAVYINVQRKLNRISSTPCPGTSVAIFWDVSLRLSEDSRNHELQLSLGMLE